MSTFTEWGREKAAAINYIDATLRDTGGKHAGYVGNGSFEYHDAVSVEQELTTNVVAVRRMYCYRNLGLVMVEFLCNGAFCYRGVLTRECSPRLTAWLRRQWQALSHPDRHTR